MNQFYALQHLPLADMVMISASAPMYTVFFARIFIKVLFMSFYPDFQKIGKNLDRIWIKLEKNTLS